MIKNLKGLIPLFLLILFSCKKESNNIGLNLRSDGGAIDGTTMMITDLSCRTIAEDSLRTDSLSTNILGVINDPLFGLSKASLIVQPRLPEFGFDFTGASLDSIVLSLKYQRSQILDNIELPLVYGNLDNQVEIEVFRLNEDLVSGKKYYSNSEYNLGTKVGSFTGKFNFFDSVLVQTTTDTFNIAPQLTIRLDDLFGIDLLNQPTSVFADAQAFLDYLKGLVLVPKDYSLAGGVMVGIDVINPASNLKVYYNDSLSKEFIFDAQSKHIGKYEQVTQSAEIINQKNAPSGQHFNTTYTQAMAGAKVRLEVPGLNEIIEAGDKVAINEAKVTVKIQSGTTSEEYPAPYRVLMLVPHPVTGANNLFVDFIDDLFPPNQFWRGLTNYGGVYESSIGGYEFHFNRYLQELIDQYNETGVNNFNGFYFLVPSDFPIIPGRAVLNTSIGQGIQLSVTYSKLN